jgi:hypothetical protein
MRKWLGTIAIFTTIFLVQACAPKAQEDCGFVQNSYGERVSWKGEIPATIRIHQDVPEAMVPAIVAAADSWERTAGRKLFNVVTSSRYTGPIAPNKDGVNVIYFMSSWESDRGSEQGRTSVYWVGDQIKEADIRLNGSDFSYYWNSQTLSKASKASRSLVPVNIEALVLHELGHVLGLKHKDNSGSVMATYLASGEDRVAVASIDEKALQCEY